MSDFDEGHTVTTKINTVDDNNYPKESVIIPIMNSPIFPGMIAPIILSEDKFTPELDKQIGKTGYVALNLVKLSDELNNDEIEDEEVEEIEIDSGDIYKVGVLCKVVKKLVLPDGSVNVLVHGMKRYRAVDIITDQSLLKTKVDVFSDIIESDEELDAYTRSVINQVKKLSEINPYFNEEMKLAMLNSPSPGALADLVAFAISLDISEAQDFLETLVVKKRFAKLLVYLKREKEVADIQKKISEEVNDKVNKYQREYFLREQLKVIRSELGMDEDEKTRDIRTMNERLESSGIPEETLKSIREELTRLEVIPDSSPEYNVARSYINWLLDLPWENKTDDKIDIKQAEKILEKEHYGLEKAKERILEFLAVRKINPDYDGTLLCFSGPPGVGKTSLGRSVANSLGRKFYRFSLGGMRDEAEIKGHRRTYVGAMPGKIIQALKRVEVNNPVIMLDEIDKLGKSFQGDPASALLEVLDPEQNHSFIDNYLDIPFDLSKVVFIATANYINDIPEPLLDRMEIIELSGYSLEEKVEITNKWIIPKQLKKHGLLKKDFKLSIGTIKKIISDYAREPGVRTIEQYIAKLCRKAALKKVSTRSIKKFSPKTNDLEKLLGSPRFQTEFADKKSQPGVVTGLAWTAYGGDILSIETIPLEGKGGFKLTGQLGDVMNESANLAYSYIRKLLQLEKDNKSDYLSKHEVHLHLPAGATPKDGPSAGITMALALYSLAMNKKIKPDIAMTGELSLTGKVLPVGGIKEKVLAAKRAGIKTIILPSQNEKDLKEVPERHRKGLKFYPVSHFDDVLKVVLPSKRRKK
ncbi:MAG: endopeptidase La [Bdellovibrionales bacterium]|jgi:ATP-dependent Lon protease|nr:endopeptidase La [Bdellovibrionales bacterium]